MTKREFFSALTGTAVAGAITAVDEISDDPNRTIVVALSGYTSQEQMVQLKAQLSERFPNRRILVHDATIVNIREV